MRTRYVAPFLACLTLAAPAGAAAHAKRVAILDGDRSLRVTAVSAPVVVLGDLHEPMLRIGPSGAWANRASPTAIAERLVTSGRGWRRVGGSTYAWHDHRLAPPPYSDERAGAIARFSVPVRIARAPLTLAAGAVAGFAAVASLASFGAADSTTGRVAWVELALARRVVCALAFTAGAAAAAVGLLTNARHP